MRGSSWFAKRGRKRVRGGNHVNWAGEKEGKTAECKQIREKRAEKNVDRSRNREESGEAEAAEWDE